jgi:hypothetical protein
MPITTPIPLALTPPPVEDMDRLAIEHLAFRRVKTTTRDPDFGSIGALGDIAAGIGNFNGPLGKSLLE